MSTSQANAQRLYAMPFAEVYRALIAKAERKGRRRAEVDEVTRWLTGYDQPALDRMIADGTSHGDVFRNAPAPHPARSAITGVICGVRIAEITDPLMREIRYLDKLVDELAKGRPLAKILRA